MIGGCVGVISVGGWHGRGKPTVAGSSVCLVLWLKAHSRDGATGDAACGVVSSRTSERQRTLVLHNGAYVEEFGNSGILDVSGIGSSAMVSGTGSLCHKRWCHWNITCMLKDLHTE